jgi:predicted RNase H-like HicB family nuclease
VRTGDANRVDGPAYETFATVGGRADVRFYNFEIVIEKEAEDERNSAYSPSLPGCFGNGRTIEEAKRNMREAIRQHVSALLVDGERLLQPDRLMA